MAMFSAIASAVCSNMPNCKFNWMATCFGSNAEDNRVVVEDGAFSVDNHTTTFIKCCVTEVHQEQNEEAWKLLSQKLVQQYGEEVADIIARKHFPQNQQAPLKQAQVQQVQNQAEVVDHKITELKTARMFHKQKEFQAKKGSSEGSYTPPSRTSPNATPITANVTAANFNTSDNGMNIGSVEGVMPHRVLTATSVADKEGASINFIHRTKETAAASTNTTTTANVATMTSGSLHLEKKPESIRVVKRNNQVQNFDPEKIKKSLFNVPVQGGRMTAEMIEDVASNVIKQLLARHENAISSEDLETLVVEQLTEMGFMFRQPEIYTKMAPVMFERLCAQRISPEDYDKFLEVFKAVHVAFSGHVSETPILTSDFQVIQNPVEEHVKKEFTVHVKQHDQHQSSSETACCWPRHKSITPINSKNLAEF